MKISRTFYNEAGELMAPSYMDVNRTSALPGGTPSVEPGFYHLFKFEGRTEKERQEKYRRFFTGMPAVPGYMTLSQSPYTVELGNFVRYGVRVMYVIESAEEAAEAARRADALRAQRRASSQPHAGGAVGR